MITATAMSIERPDTEAGITEAGITETGIAGAVSGGGTGETGAGGAVSGPKTTGPAAETAGVEAALILHRWLSPAFPTGAFAWSHGLETDVAEGRVSDAAAAQGWVAACLSDGSLRNDAIFLAAAWRARPSDLPGLAGLARAFAPSAERLAETEGQGRAFAQTVAAVHGLDLPPMPYPLAVGRAARLMDLPLPLTLTLCLQAAASSLISAAARLVPLGQTEAQAALVALAPLVAATAADTARGDTDALGGFTPRIDIAAMRHETLATRLFRS